VTIYRHQGTISSPKSTQNHVQNPTGDGSDNSDGIFGIEGVCQQKTSELHTDIKESDDEDKAARLSEYDRLSALSRKKSKNAGKEEEPEF
jgi:hypothetical protein